ncbi:FAD/NAD(P)-binding domain superfamily [Fusarium oxysporum f. sp. vasinfectum]|nr:FAD/NAD(P)-binding domain superfamily [Fusarium oxysporum f. sp. vasinfectum]
MSSEDQKTTYSRFACIGTGLSGIGLGATLKRWYNLDDIHYFERQSQPGGTWLQNQYPGCACDIPNILYSFSFEPNPDWTRILAKREELYDYIMRVAKKYHLLNKMTFGAQVEKCEWSEEHAQWRLTIRDLESGSLFSHECQFLFSATGLFSNPRELDIPGVKSFKGPIIHSAKWRHDVNLTGKRVVLFGNGCTAAQIVPNILPQTKSLTQIIRSKHWILPPIDGPTLDVLRWVMKNIPGVQRLLRVLVFLETERQYKLFEMTEAGARVRAKFRETALTYMKKTAPVKYHDLLIPDFEFGCKRRIYDSGYLESIHADNFSLTDKPATEITPDGVRVGGQVIEADVIVLANGFETGGFLKGIEVIGRNNENLHQHWERYGGAEAYNTTSVSGFPNLFLLYGPNSGVGHTSAIIALENGINYSLRVVKPILDGKASIVDVKSEAESIWTDSMQTGVKSTVFYSGCTNWFVETKKNGKRWNATVYPYSQASFWRRSLFPVWKDFDFSGSTNDPKRNIWRRLFLRNVSQTLYASIVVRGDRKIAAFLAPKFVRPGRPKVRHVGRQWIPALQTPSRLCHGRHLPPGARFLPDNLAASPSCRSIVGNSDAEAQFEPSGIETVHAANQMVSPTPVDYPVIMVVYPFHLAPPANSTPLQANEQDVSISSLAYFSNSKLIALSRRIGTTQVADLLAKIEAAVKSTTRSPVGVSPYPNDLEKEARSVSLSQQSRLDYIQSYFDQVHPLYPFLDRASFENRARSSRVGDIRSVDPAWCALYHAVLGLGSLYHECGSFNAFSGTAWDIFRVSLALFPRIVFGQTNLVTVQAMAAMAIFSVTYAALPIEGVLISEAARIVSHFQMTKAEACKTNQEFQRTFWVIYSLESEYCLNTGRSSIIPSHDISCPIPQTNLPFLSGFNWLQCKAKHAQMASDIYQRLFSVKARSSSQALRQREASRCLEELETWRLSVPESFRPGLRLRSHRLGQPQAVYLAVQIHFSYYNVRIALARVCLLAWVQDSEEQTRYKLLLTESARSIIDLVHFIDLEPFVLPWVQYNMPQAALFVLFDFIIEYPCHEETRKNLSYMQIATAYFMRLQYITGNMVFGTILTQFLQIATKFMEGTCISSITQPEVSANPRGSELWQSRDSGIGTIGFEESLGFQGLQFPIHNGFEFQDMDFWLTESGVLSFLESSGDFGLPNPESEGPLGEAAGRH